MDRYLVGVGAGLVSSVLILAAGSGGALSVFLLFLVSVPIAIAALGWGTKAAVAATIAGVVSTALATNPLNAISFALFSLIPVAIAGYLIGLARPAGEVSASQDMNASPDGLVWFPLSYVLAIMAALVGVSTAIIFAMIGDQLELLSEMLSTEAQRQFAELDPTLTPEEVTALAENIASIYLGMTPFVVGFGLTLILVFNVWLGARIVSASGRLSRPWPDLADIQLSTPLPQLFLIAVLAAFMSGDIGFSVRPVAGAFFAAFFLAGLAVIHMLLRGRPGRSFLLFLTYISIFLLSIPAIVITVIGALEPFLKLRKRSISQGGQPPNS